MSDQDAVFDDMAENLTTTGFYQAIELLKNRQLRVFTMCSGTEAPIIAMRKLKAASSERVSKDSMCIMLAVLRLSRSSRRTSRPISHLLSSSEMSQIFTMKTWRNRTL